MTGAGGSGLRELCGFSSSLRGFHMGTLPFILRLWAGRQNRVGLSLSLGNSKVIGRFEYSEPASRQQRTKTVCFLILPYLRFYIFATLTRLPSTGQTYVRLRIDPPDCNTGPSIRF